MYHWNLSDLRHFGISRTHSFPIALKRSALSTEMVGIFENFQCVPSPRRFLVGIASFSDKLRVIVYGLHVVSCVIHWERRDRVFERLGK